MNNKVSEREITARFERRSLMMLESYKTGHTPILTRCLVCQHEWKIAPSNVYRGSGCRKCDVKKKADRCRLTHDQASERFSARGLEMLESYKLSGIRILTRCLSCKHEWRPQPNHIFRGGSCPNCVHYGRKFGGGGYEAYRPPLLSQSEVVTRFSKNGLEPLEQYKGWSKAILTRCNKCDYQWRARPGNIFKGMQCRHCVDWGFNTQKPATLYYVKVLNPFGKSLYKIGITNRTVRKRLKGDLDKIVELEVWYFESGAEAFEMEQDILRDHAAHRYSGRKVLNGTGNEELFTCDVLGLDKGAGQLELIA